MATYPLPVVALNAVTLVPGTPQLSTAQTSATMVKAHAVSYTVSGINDAVNNAAQSFGTVAKTPTAVTISLLGNIDGTATYYVLGSKTLTGNGSDAFFVKDSPALSVKVKATTQSGASNATVTAWVGSV